MNPSPLTEGRLFKAWVAFFLVTAVGGAIARGVLGFILGAAGVDGDRITRASGLLGFLIALPIFYGAFRWAVLQFCLPPVPPLPPPPLSGDS